MVSEEEIAAGVLALLYHESQLVEGGGAAGLAALIAGKIDKNNGKIGIIFTGGNITTSNLSKIINYPFTEKILFDYINIYGEKVSKKIPLKGVNFSDNLERSEKIDLAKLGDQDTDVLEDIEYLKGRYDDVHKKIQKYHYRFDEYISYCEIKKISIDRSSVETFKNLDQIAKKELSELQKFENLKRIKDPVDYNKNYTEYIQKYRSLLHVVQAMSLVLDWRSASYGQSVDTMFFNLNSQDNPSVNYNRYESDRLVSIEKQMAEVLGVDQNKTSVLLTSSGMAAYTLIESYLIRHVLNLGDKVYIPQYLYFETNEQISQINGIEVLHEDVYKVDEVIDTIKREKPKIVFLDPIINTVDLRMTDVYQVVDRVSKFELQYDMFIAIDGSLMSGELDLKRLFNNQNERLHIIYYDSCSKYLQLGMDIAMGGLVAFPVELSPLFDRLRRNTGTILYDVAANIFPEYDRKTQKRRMRRFARNALLISKIVGSDKEIAKVFKVIYPMLKNHIDHEVSKNYDSVGGIITFSFKDESLNSRESLNSLIELILHFAKKNKISITRGLSFGFSLPRISAASSMAENTPPFLRLSVGDRSYVETTLLAESLLLAVKEYLQIKDLR